MPKIKYEEVGLKPDTIAIIEQAEAICIEYERMGYQLTLRQLYYQFVARGIIPNSQRSYKNLGSAVDKGRMAGMIDWNHIEDRTRNLAGRSHWESPADIIEASAQSFALDRWTGQELRIEVWVEKEALAGVIERAATSYDVNYFSCRGYVSSSEMWRAGRRHRLYYQRGQRVLVLHLGDHDPSGLDMTRDITDRLHTFGGSKSWDMLEVRRIALNMDQIRQYNPPPNPAKLTDARGSAYVEEYGDDSWELDALPPDVLEALINEHISEEVDHQLYQRRMDEEEEGIRLLRDASNRWDELVDVLAGSGGDDE